MSRIRTLAALAAAGAAITAVTLPATASADEPDTASLETLLDTGSQAVDIIDQAPGGIAASVSSLGLPGSVGEGLDVGSGVLRGTRNPLDLINVLDFAGSLAPTAPCPATTEAGQVGVYKQWVDIGRPGPATIPLRYETYDIPDTIIVSYHGQEIYRDGPIGTNGDVHRTLTVPPGTDGRVLVTILAPEQGTQWNYTVGCAG